MKIKEWHLDKIRSCENFCYFMLFIAFLIVSLKQSHVISGSYFQITFKIWLKIQKTFLSLLRSKCREIFVFLEKPYILLENWTHSIIMVFFYALALWKLECGFIDRSSFHQLRGSCHEPSLLSLTLRIDAKCAVFNRVSGMLCSFPYVCFAFCGFHYYLCFMMFVRFLDFIKVTSYCVWKT